MSKIILAKNAGFCFGVKRAVDTVFNEIEKNRYSSIYTFGELIHNHYVTDILKKKGVITANSLDDISSDKPDETLVIIRSHGVPRKITDELKARGYSILDLTCPFVKRIHKTVAGTTSENLIIMGVESHPEVAGIIGYASSRNIYVINKPEDVLSLPKMNEALVVAQTTFAKNMWQILIDLLQNKIDKIIPFNSICDTTRKRQNEAEELAKKSDAVYVIGGKHSSNTEKLYNLCRSYCNNVFYIDNIKELSLENIRNNDIISICAGASTPEWIIMEVFERMSDVVEQGTQEVEVKEETVVTPTEVNAENATEEVISSDNIDEEDFASQLEKTFVYIKKGQLVTGTVIQVNEDEVCVSIGYKSDGIIKKENLSAQGDANPLDLFKAGDSIDAEVVTLNDGEGNVVLSRKSIEAKLKWKNLVENLDLEKTYTIKVDKVVKGGVTSKLEGYDAFIPASQMSLKYVEDLSEFVGQEIEVSILDVDKKQRRFVLSRKTLLLKEEEEKEKALYASFNKGDKITGKIKRITDFGAFVDIGGVDGLLHVTDISWTKVKHPSDVLKNGDEIEVLIMNVDSEKKRISLGLKQLQPKPWDTAEEKYPVGSEVEGKVVRILPFGAFVSLEPTIDGLVHVSQITNRRLEKVEEELRVGDIVKAKVIGVDTAKKRITLSMKALLPEEEKKEKEKEHESKSKDENFKFELSPVENATSSLADFFPKAED